MFETALGNEPPLRVDLDTIEAKGARSLRRRRLIVPAVAATCVAGVTLGVVLVANTGRPSGPSGVEMAASPSTTGSSAKAPGPGFSAAPTNRVMAYCYRTADITTTEPGQHTLIGSSGGPEGRGDVASRALSICGKGWTDNAFDWWPSTAAPLPVPNLVACVLGDDAHDVEDGTVGVFPGTAETCAELGLPLADL
ncbi:hypothetical protein JOD54_004240 [Actinokineospora baliensis]|uniref:hypothetical protein n=1 Tax=Actinokineospora baliensis TaxID=547056 RepID=UPI00195B6474|nr:hypothetical protein [Actinokineospora baliensis]MBM7774036.1 hypothetical protein [Actinokineospora baliensis]